MSTSASAILFSKFSFNLHPCLVSLPWFRRNVVRCFSQNADVSGLPVRYIPKNCRDVNQRRRTGTVDITPKELSTGSTSSGFQPKGFEHSESVHGSSNYGTRLDCSFDAKHELNHEDEHGNEVSEKLIIKVPPEVVECVKTAEEIPQKPRFCKGGGLSQGLKFNEEMSNDGLIDEEYMEASEEVVEETQLYNGSGKGKSDRPKQAVEKKAIELLAKRAFTAVELQKKLSAKQFPANIVKSVVQDFQQRGLINDGLYAEMFSQSRWKSSSWGPRRIKHALKKKGVSEGHVEKAVKLVFEDPKEGDQRPSIRLSSSSLHQLYMQASKQWQRSQNVPHETRKARVIRWLQYRGFDWGVIGTIMKQLESERSP